MEAILELAKKRGILRPKDVEAQGLPKKYVYRLYDRGKLQKIGRGLYKLPETNFSVNTSLLEACRRIEQGVICLVSALEFHGMTSQIPTKVWMAIHHKDWSPDVKFPLEIVRMTGDSFSRGIMQHTVDQVEIQVYSPAKTVADCFKFRSKLGLEVCLSALSNFREQNMGTMDDIWKYAKINRVQKIMRPYMEAQQ